MSAVLIWGGYVLFFCGLLVAGKLVSEARRPDSWDSIYEEKYQKGGDSCL